MVTPLPGQDPVRSLHKFLNKNILIFYHNNKPQIMYQSSRQYENRTEADEIKDLLGQVDNRKQRIKDRLNQTRQNLEEKARDEIRESFFDVLGASQAQRHGVEQIMNAPFAAHEVLMVKDAMKKGYKYYFGDKDGEMKDAPTAEAAEEGDIPEASPYFASERESGYSAGTQEPIDRAVGGYGDKDEISEMRSLAGRSMPEDETINDISDLTAASRSTGTFGRTAGFQDVDSDITAGSNTARTNIARPRVREENVPEQESAPEGGDVELKSITRNPAQDRAEQRRQVKQDDESQIQEQEGTASSGTRGGEVEMQSFDRGNSESSFVDNRPISARWDSSGGYGRSLDRRTEQLVQQRGNQGIEQKMAEERSQFKQEYDAQNQEQGGGEVEMQSFNRRPAQDMAEERRQFKQEYDSQMQEQPDPRYPKEGDEGFVQGKAGSGDSSAEARGYVEEKEDMPDTSGDYDMAYRMQSDQMAKTVEGVSRQGGELAHETQDLQGRGLIDSFPRKSDEADLEGSDLIDSFPRKAAPEAEEAGEEGEAGEDVADAAAVDTTEEIGAATAGIPGLDILGGLIAAVGAGFQLYEGAENIISSGKETNKASVERSQASNLLGQAGSVRAPAVSSSQAGRYAAPVVSRAGEFY